MTDDLTIPGPLQMKWRDNGLWPDLMLSEYRLGSVAEDFSNPPHWTAWLNFNSPGGFSGTKTIGAFDTESAARAALIAAVKEAVKEAVAVGAAQ